MSFFKMDGIPSLGKSPESSAWGVPRSSVVSSTGTSALVEAARNDKIVILPLGNILMDCAYNKILYIIIYIYLHN